MLLRKLCLLLLIGLATTGCSKPTPEGELKKFEAHKAAAATLQTTWAGFSSYIEEDLKKGEEAFKAAQSANDLEAMKTANQSSMPLLSKLERCNSRLKNCEDDIARMRKLKLGKKSHQERVDKAAALDSEVLAIRETLQAASPADLTEAQAIAEEQSGLLLALENKCSSAYTKYKKKTPKSKGKKRKKK